MAFSRLHKVLKASAPSSTGYVHIYDTQLVEAPKDLLDGTDGLAAIQQVRRDDGKLSFIAYWASSEGASLSGPALRERLSASATPLSGFAGELVTRSPPDLWGRVKDKALPLLLTTVAVIAALEGLNNRYEALIAAPQFTVRFDAPVYNIDEGDAVSASLTVENALTGVELSEIHVAPILSADPNGRPSGSIEMLKLQDAALPATKSRTYYMSLKDLPPGEHLVTAAVTAKAGRFRGSESVPVSAKVVVWPSEAEASITYKQTRHNRADFLFTLRVGKLSAPSIVTCDLKFTGKLTTPNNFWRPRGKTSGPPRWIEGPESNVLTVTWPALPGHSKHYAELSLVGDGDTDWDKVAANSKPMCSVN
jgi:hypothetical protein